VLLHRIADASIAVAAGGWPSMAESRVLRLGTILLLYVAQGIPVGLFFFAIPGWLSVNGASASTIGLVATLSALPWSLKFFNGFLMDRYAFLPMGRRRAWLMGAQTLIVVGLVAFALASPRPDQALLIGSFSLVIMAATTFQDVAIDGIAVDIVPDEERARANGFMFGGQSFGIAGGAAMTGYAISRWGPTTAFLLVGASVGAILLLIVVARERQGERLLPWTNGCAARCNLHIHASTWRTVFTTAWRALTNRHSFLISVALFLTGTAYGVYPALGAMIASHLQGWNEARIGALQGLGNLVAGAVGVLVGGWLADRIGPRRFGLIVLGAVIWMAAAMIALSSRWADPDLLTAFIIGWVVLDVLIKVALLPIAMRLCDVTVGATQFAIYMALANLGITVASALLPALDAVGGYRAMFGFVALANAAAVPFLLTARVGR
jgi:PAT family beta-lactamase induction signal transducer AmpG